MFPRVRNVLAIVCIALVAGSCASVDRSSAPASALGISSTPPADREAAAVWDANGFGPSSPAVPGAQRDTSVFGSTADEPEAERVERPRIEVRTADTLGERASAVGQSPQPRSVTIAGLDITALVQPSGIDGRGEFDLPPGEEAGWYRFGPSPGEEGSAVIAAHVDWNGVPGAFFELREAKPGQHVVIDFDDDSTAKFRIVEVRQYDKTSLPLDELFVRSGDPQLTLITCGGDFDAASRSYEDNVVVIAEPV